MVSVFKVAPRGGSKNKLKIAICGIDLMWGKHSKCTMGKGHGQPDWKREARESYQKRELNYLDGWIHVS